MYENKTKEALLQELGVNAESGLTQQEAEKRLQANGKNKLQEKPSDPWYKIFWGNIADPMTLILAIAALISLALGIVNIVQGKAEKGKEWLDFVDVIIIFGVVIINAVIGTIQEMKAEKALEALKQMSSPSATVKRDGKIITIKAEDVVLGDIVILEEGRTVPADIRLLSGFSLKANESSLTGESVPCQKDPELVCEGEVGVGDRSNEVFMSTPIVYGHGEGVVIGTGMGTEIGKIAGMLSEGEEEDTPLQKKLAQLSKFLGYLTIGIVVLMLIVKIVYLLVQGGIAEGWPQALLDSVALAVAAIPEGLTAVVTIVLAMGMSKMVKVNSIVRRLASVETLGAVSYICSDKTGTLTQNKMTVVSAFEDGNIYEGESLQNPSLSILAKGMCLCSDAKIEGGTYGDPTEVALVEFADKMGMSKSSLEAETPRIDELPFDSVRKMMSTKQKTDKGCLIYTKGAMDQILAHSKSILVKGEEEPLTQDWKDKIENAASAFASKALRVLALAISHADEGSQIEEENLCFVGLVGMVDPPRPECKQAVATLKEAGITTVMITGDHKDTALAIATELGIADDSTQAMTGAEIDACSKEELQDKVKTVRVFARVSPENKVQIVEAIKDNGNVAAMTGDGVNDAPSLKQADIGIAMGITGTDVAKGAADMVLADDNFASIEKAVEEGRGIYANIKKTILFLVSSNIGEVVCMLIGALVGLPSPLIAIHLLWVNLITDSLPAVALGADKKPDDIMRDSPRDPKESLFSKGGYGITFGYGVLIGVITLAAFLVNAWQAGCYSLDAIQVYFEDEIHLEVAQSMAFCVLSFSELFHMLGMTNTKKSFINVFKDKNPLLWISFFLGFALQFFVIETPGVNEVFKVYPLSHDPIDYAWVFGLAVMPLVVHEIVALVLLVKRKISK